MSFETNRAIHPMFECSRKRIKERKKGLGKKPIKSGMPKRLWDDCLELESYIRSNAAHGLYKLDQEVSETIMSRHQTLASSVSLNGLNG